MNRLFAGCVWVLSLAFTGCGQGGVPLYFKVGLGTASSPAGTNCQGPGNSTETLTGINNSGMYAIYALPNNQYVLDTGSTGILGTLAGSTYTFTGSDVVDTKGSATPARPEVTTTTKTTITVTTSGSGVTGTAAFETSCTSSDNTGCGGAGGSTDAKDYDCTSNSTVVGTQVHDVQQIASVVPQ